MFFDIYGNAMHFPISLCGVVNIGSFFLMFFDIYGNAMHFPISLCGVEDSGENYQTFHFMLCVYSVSPMKFFFFVFPHISRSLS